MVVVVSAPLAVQRARVLSRPGMKPNKLDALLRQQMPDAEKRRHAHFVVDSSLGVDYARRQVHGILRATAAVPGRQAPAFPLRRGAPGAGDRARYRDDRP